MIKEDVLQYLKDSGYLLQVDGNTIITNKFLRDIGARAITAKNSNSKSSSRNTNSTVDTSKDAYKQFIADAGVPRLINNGYGGKFYANNYSKPGHDAWKNALDDHELMILLAATKYYYKQTTIPRVMIGNFFKEGIYESFVDDIKKAMANRDKKVTVLGDDKSYSMTPDQCFIMPDHEEEDRNSLRL